MKNVSIKQSTLAAAFLRTPSTVTGTGTTTTTNNNNELSVEMMMMIMINTQLLLTYHKDILVKAIVVLQFTKADEKR